MPGNKSSVYFCAFFVLSCAASHSAIDDIRNPIAGVEDFPQIVDGIYYTFQEMPFDIPEFRVLNQMFNGTRRSQNFTFPIFVDDVPEGAEELQLTLSLQADDQLPQGSVNVTPAVATVRIHDSSCKLLFGHGFSLNNNFEHVSNPWGNHFIASCQLICTWYNVFSSVVVRKCNTVTTSSHSGKYLGPVVLTTYNIACICM